MNKTENLNLIEKYRAILNRMINNEEPFEDIYKVSIELDELINTYMK